MVSPFKLIINEGNYYLLAYNERYKKILTYRLDRMREIEYVYEEILGEDEFASINIETYTKEHFGMFAGEKKRVQIRFINRLLDVAIDRFGTGRDVIYQKIDDKHFSVFIDVAISDQFFGWICGFRNKAVIVSPKDVIKQLKEYIDDINNSYKEESQS